MNAVEDSSWAQQLAARYNVTADVTYLRAGGFDVKLDVYHPRTVGVPQPAVMFMHGGGWMADATKQTWALWFLPFLKRGWIVVNVDYRPSAVSQAPAAVEDCLCALRWIGRNAVQFNIDAKQLIIAGLSAGGHLALTTGMIPQAMSRRGARDTARDELSCASEVILESADLLKPIAIVNWCGVTDVADVAFGPNRQDFAAKWIGERPNFIAVAKLVSPLSYVCAGLAPIITIHGDNDELVPYRHAVRLHEALAAAKVPNELVTISGAKHAALEGYLDAYPQIFDFLMQAGVTMHPR